MPVLGLLAMSSVIAAAPAGPSTWYLGDDYPIEAFERRWEGATLFQLTVDPNGRPVHCAVEVSSGHGLLDKRACSIAMKRARFMQALSSRGTPAYGVYRTRLNWALDPANFAQSEIGPDFEVSVSRLPDGSSGPVSVKYAVEVDAAGNPVACNPFPGSHKTLGELGCAKLKQDYRKTVSTPDGRTVAAVQTAWITFTP